jgi:hypothetical protein
MSIGNILPGDKRHIGWAALCQVGRASIMAVDDQARIGCVE